MNHSKEISKTHAQLLMSQLVDGELSSPDAKRLEEYLQNHPDESDWMENLDTVRDTTQPTVLPRQRKQAIASILSAVKDEPAAPARKGNLISFPSLLRPMAAAAAIAIVGTVTWLGLRPNASPEFEPSAIEFVSTDIPNASTYIYPDEETGWTVVWVDTEVSDKG